MFSHAKTANHRAKTWLGISLTTLALLAGGLYLATRLCLFVETDQGTRLIIPVKKGDPFSLKYIHSVQKTPVAENFIIVGADELVLDSTVYETYGVGLPFLPGEGSFERRDGKFILSGIGRKFAKVALRTSPIAGQVLETGGRTIPLYALHESGASVTIRAKPYYHRWLHID
jgi:hypothetical protein